MAHFYCDVNCVFVETGVQFAMAYVHGMLLPSFPLGLVNTKDEIPLKDKYYDTRYRSSNVCDSLTF